MPTRAIISLFTFLFVIGALGVGTVAAQKYTARNSSNQASSSSSSKLEKCAIGDLRAIKKFDRKVDYTIKKITLSDEKNKAVSNKEIGSAKRSLKEAQKAGKLFESKEYEQMKKVYKRCGKKMPRAKQETPFWIPKRLRSADVTCSDCAKK